jgi:hypothetical protein
MHNCFFFSSAHLAIFHAKKMAALVLIASATATTAASAIEVRLQIRLERLIPFQSSANTKIRKHVD